MIALLVLGLVVVVLYEKSKADGGGAPGISSPVVQKIARAIAKAEGFYVSGSLPQRANNPGDLKAGDKGFGTIAGKTVFGSVQEGWNHLYSQVSIILQGVSHYYQPGFTINQMAQIYTGSDNAAAWANIVASDLGVSTETRLDEIS